jgi:hypothetical protein
MEKPLFVLILAGVTGCGGGGTGTGGNMAAPDMTPASIVGQHGRVVDYFNLTPLVGFTVSDGTNTATTDADGQFLLPAPMGATLAQTVTGPSYSTLHLPQGHAVGSDVDLGPIVIPSSATFNTELSLLSADMTKALVQVVIIPTGACTSVAGGTLTVVKPAGASIAYFSPSGFPGATQMYDNAAMSHRPAAVVFNLEPGAELEIQMSHPTCTLAPSGTAYNGAAYDGLAPTVAAEPGDNNSAVVLLAQ